MELVQRIFSDGSIIGSLQSVRRDILLAWPVDNVKTITREFEPSSSVFVVLDFGLMIMVEHVGR